MHMMGIAGSYRGRVDCENGDINAVMMQSFRTSIKVNLHFARMWRYQDGKPSNLLFFLFEVSNVLFSPPQERSKTRETQHFKDGVRRIDYILAYKVSEDPDHEVERNTFERNLQKEGLELEYEDKQVWCWICAFFCFFSFSRHFLFFVSKGPTFHCCIMLYSG